MARSYLESDPKLLWGLAAARCAFPRCRQVLAAKKTDRDSAAVLGEIAHIVAHEDEGPRGDPSCPAARRDRYENLILLCPTHHTLVDKQPSTFTISDLRTWKRQHEVWVAERLLPEAMGRFEFRELEVLTLSLVSAPGRPSRDFDPLDPGEKLKRNGLSDMTHHLLAMGFSQARQVREFVAMMTSRDADWPERLKAGFVVEYRSLRNRGFDRDALYQGLCLFARGDRTDMAYWAAGLAVVAYLFETCEVFEKRSCPPSTFRSSRRCWASAGSF